MDVLKINDDDDDDDDDIMTFGPPSDIRHRAVFLFSSNDDFCFRYLYSSNLRSNLKSHKINKFI